MMLIGDSEGRLRVQRQVEDYAYRGVEFETMGFLTFVVETYERRLKNETTGSEKEQRENSGSSPMTESGRYMNDHSRSSTHVRVCRADNHNTLPNIVGPWLPRRDGEESTRPFYFAAMLAFLKPWRDLNRLKNDGDTWESAFDRYMQTASQRDRDVVSGCQYYYDTRSAVDDSNVDDEQEHHLNDGVEFDRVEMEDENVIDDGSVTASVSRMSLFSCRFIDEGVRKDFCER
jgi:hypothetical protein